SWRSVLTTTTSRTMVSARKRSSRTRALPSRLIRREHLRSTTIWTTAYRVRLPLRQSLHGRLQYGWHVNKDIGGWTEQTAGVLIHISRGYLAMKCTARGC